MPTTAVDHAPPFHKGVDTLMNIGDAGDPVPPPPTPGLAAKISNVGLMVAAGLWGYAAVTSRRETARFAKGATAGFAVARAALALQKK